MNRRILICLSTSLLLMTGCVSMLANMMMNGGDIVKTGYQPEVLVDFRAEGKVPAGTSYHLIKTEKGGLAVFEKSPDGSGTVITNQWEEGADIHFFAWVGSSHGYEYVVPKDRTSPAKKYFYPAGYFSVEKDEAGVQRPVAVAPLDPVATLYPET